MKYNYLKNKYPRFIYRKYSYKITEGNLKISFLFEIPPAIRFRPQIVIKNINETRSDRVSFDNFVFHLGLMEMPSYWKATGAPEIVIEAGYLNKDQIKWWKDLIIKGMGQFFYENRIDWRSPNFLKIINLQRTVPCRFSGEQFSAKSKNRYLVPMGGGKDSIVTLEKLKTGGKETNCFVVNPTEATKKVLKVAGVKNPIIIERKIDPTLLELNKKGYLNGHTPFTALLSFLSVFCAVLFDYKHIAFSNEKSADEGNVMYLGKMINHQWAKSFEFERKFKNYCQKYLTPEVKYFSFLRKYSELEIAKMFTRYPKYFPVFSSCNVAGKMGDRWCGGCPKCLFIYAVLYPYLEKKELLKIFDKDFFGNKKLLPVMKSLVGRGSHKPFECVGTYKENKRAFELSLEKAKKSGKLPHLLQKFNVFK